MLTAIFTDRKQAGQLLANKLSKYAADPAILVLGLPRGGVPVAYPIALQLNAPLDVFLVRKLGAPGNEELAIGAIAANGISFINEALVQSLQIPQEAIDAIQKKERAELARRMALYHKDKPALAVKGKRIILVDDGLATGATMKAAIAALRLMQPQQIIIAIPVTAEDTLNVFQGLVDEVICLATPSPFYGVGMWYQDFTQTSDAEVIELLAKANRS